MAQALEWYNLVFYIALTVGLLFALGAAFGVGDDHGHDHHAGHDHDHGHGSKDKDGKAVNPLDASAHELSWFSDLLGVGRVPFTIIVMLLFALFGGVGIMGNTLLKDVLKAPWLFFPVSAGIAAVASIVLTGRLARLIHRVMPTSESYNITKRDLVGRSGRIQSKASDGTAFAVIADSEGNAQQVACRLADASVAIGTEIVTTAYDHENDIYQAEPFQSGTDRADA